MDGALATTLIVGVLSSGALVALINNLFQRKRDKESKATGAEAKIDTIVAKVNELANEQTEMLHRQKKQEGDILRVELRLMISDFPDKEEDILRLGEHYFKDLKANWVMASVYQQWLNARNLPTPPWFRNE